MGIIKRNGISYGGGGGISDIDSATPSFEEATEIANIESGETVSTLFGKIKKVISTLLSFGVVAEDELSTEAADLRDADTLGGKYTAEDLDGMPKSENIEDYAQVEPPMVDADYFDGHSADYYAVKERTISGTSDGNGVLLIGEITNEKVLGVVSLNTTQIRLFSWNNNYYIQSQNWDGTKSAQMPIAAKVFYV